MNTVPSFICLVAVIMFVPVVVRAAEVPTYLEHERLDFLTDTTEVRTSLPLEPYRLYVVTITSPFDLRPLLSWSSWDFSINDRREGNGNASHWRTIRDGDHITSLIFHYRGDGRPFALRTIYDESNHVPVAHVEIAHYVPSLPPWPWLAVAASVFALALVVRLVRSPKRKVRKLRRLIDDLQHESDAMATASRFIEDLERDLYRKGE